MQVAYFTANATVPQFVVGEKHTGMPCRYSACHCEQGSCAISPTCENASKPLEIDAYEQAYADMLVGALQLEEHGICMSG